MSELEKKLEAAIWSAKTLFQKGVVSGSTGNISFIHNQVMYISRSGSCFGRLCHDDFAQLDLQGNILQGRPSKEFPIHLALYQTGDEYTAIIHTHSFYSTILSCYKDTEFHLKNLFSYTPYLYMMTKGKIQCVEYATPGSEALFQQFKEKIETHTQMFVLKNHGIVACAEDMYKAYNLIEEMESSAHTYEILKNCSDKDINFIAN